MKSIFDPEVHAELVKRLDRLHPESPRAWGTMNPNQAVCHLSDSIRAALGDLPVRRVGSLFLRTLGRWVALSTPLPWPKGLKTAPEFHQGIAGTPPKHFEEDVAELRSLIQRFVASQGRGLAEHVAFGALSPGEWGRWAYRHVDHHLRQFGA